MTNSFKPNGASRQAVKKNAPQNTSRGTNKATPKNGNNSTATKGTSPQGVIRFNRDLNILPENKEYIGKITEFFATKTENVYGIKIKLEDSPKSFSTTCYINPNGYSPFNDFLESLTQDDVSSVAFEDLIGLEVVFTTKINGDFCNIATIFLLEYEDEEYSEESSKNNQDDEFDEDADEAELDRFYDEDADEDDE